MTQGYAAAATHGWSLPTLAAALLWAQPGNGHLLAAWIALVLAMLPALVGGLGMLFLPSLAPAALAAALRVGSDTQPS